MSLEKISASKCCPRCNHDTNKVQRMHPEDHDEIMKPKRIAICGQCASVLIVNEQLEFEQIKLDTFLEILRDDQQIFILLNRLDILTMIVSRRAQNG